MKKILITLIAFMAMISVEAGELSIELIDGSVQDSALLMSPLTGERISVAKFSGKRKKITLIADNKTKTELLKLYNEVLNTDQLTLIGVDGGYRVINMFKAYKLSPPFAKDIENAIGFVSYLFEIDESVYADTINVLKTVSGDGGKIIEQKSTGGVMMIDSAKNIRYAKKVISRIQKETKEIINKFVLVDFADIKYIVSQVAKLKIASLDIIPDPENKQLYLSGSKADVQRAETLISGMNKKKRKIVIEALIVEVSESDTDESGVEFGIGGEFGIGVGNFSGGDGSSMASLLRGIATGNLADLTLGDGGTLATGISGSNISLGILAKAIKKSGDSAILSTPIINTIDGQKAEFVVGKNVPFITRIEQTDNPYKSVTREDVGLKLTITPTILSTGELLIDVEQEISSISESTDMDDIITDKRFLKTVMVASNGELVILGGLIDKAEEGKMAKIPLLGDIPYLGRLFSFEKSNQQKRKLLIFLKPTIIESDSNTLKKIVAEQTKKYYESDIMVYDSK